NNVFYMVDKPIFAFCLIRGKRGMKEDNNIEDLIVDNNIVWYCKDEKNGENILKESRESYGFNIHGKNVDPGFKDPLNGCFSVPENSPIFEMNIKPLTTENIGLMNDKYKI